MRRIIILIFIITLVSCEKNNEINNTACGNNVIINNDLYNSLDTSQYTITNVTLNKSLLTISISSGGCNGDSWNVTLVDANEILESNPLQRNLKISLENNEACLAIVNKDFSFDITCLKENESEIILNLNRWNQQINYN